MVSDRTLRKDRSRYSSYMWSFVFQASVCALSVITCGFWAAFNWILWSSDLVVFMQHLKNVFWLVEGPHGAQRGESCVVLMRPQRAEQRTTQRHGQIRFSEALFIIWVRVQTVTLLSLSLLCNPFHLHLHLGALPLTLLSVYASAQSIQALFSSSLLFVMCWIMHLWVRWMSSVFLSECKYVIYKGEHCNVLYYVFYSC